MMTIEEQIEHTRRFADHEQFPTFEVVAKELHKSADTMENLNAENAALRTTLDLANKLTRKVQDNYENLNAVYLVARKIKQVRPLAVKLELEAALAAMENKG